MLAASDGLSPHNLDKERALGIPLRQGRLLYGPNRHPNGMWKQYLQFWGLQRKKNFLERHRGRREANVSAPLKTINPDTGIL